MCLFNICAAATINIPLPPGSGSGAYEYAFSSLILPAVTRFRPEIILVSAGFDASFADPLVGRDRGTGEGRVGVLLICVCVI